jgi:hypothetical protein
MSVPEERDPDGTRRVGAGPSYILFLPSGDVALLTTKEQPERRALRKGRSDSVTVGTLTLTIRDLLLPKALRCEKELAIVIHSIVHKLSESASEQALKELTSMVRAARTTAHQDGERNQHKAFRSAVMWLATRLGRSPTRRELQKVIFENPDDPNPLTAGLNQKDRARMVTEWCEVNGFGWIERDKPGRPAK